MMMVARLSFLLVLALSSEAKLAPRSFVPRHGAPTSLEAPPMEFDTHQQLLALRGGGCCDTTSVANLATGVTAVHGLLNYLCPKPMCELYGNEDSPLATLLMRRTGMTLLTIAVVSYALLIQDNVSMEAAMVSTWALWATEFAATVVNKDLEAMGGTSATNALFAVLSTAFVIGLQSAVAEKWAKGTSLFVVANGVILAVATKFSLAFWGIPKYTPETESMMRDLGLWVTVSGVFLTSLAFGAEPLAAFTYSRIAVAVRSVLNMGLNGGVSSLKKPLQLFWLIYHLAIAGALYFGKESPAPITE